ncbi:MAG: WYL domain-containing protein [Casimicrobiaceae bacterium]
MSEIELTEIGLKERWGPERRREFIDFRLQWDGKINRAELVEHFGISIQQASADLARYSELAPDNLVYDKSAKVYRAAARFRPLAAASDARHYLSQLMDWSTAGARSAGSFIGWVPPCEVIHYPTRPVDKKTLLKVLWAIRDRAEIRVIYQSMRRPSTSAIWIAPHALGNDGLRWHARAWSHEDCEFRDFVLSRIQGISDSRSTSVDPAADKLWFDELEVAIRPRKGLTAAQRKAVQVDYGMKKGRLIIKCRKALAWYVLRQLHLDRPDTVSLLEQPLRCEITPEMQELISAARKQPTEGIHTHLSSRRVRHV